jgi:putative membrane protein
VFKLTNAILVAGFAVAAFAADTNPDMTFVKGASQGGAAEVKLGELAASKGQSPKVKEFGQKMIDDHTKANNDLMSIAQKKNLTVSSKLTAKDQALVNRLSGLSGDAFDKAYIGAMVKEHETDIAEFEREANSGKDDDFKSFASKTLPTLKEHLQMAKDAASTIGAQL